MVINLSVQYNGGFLPDIFLFYPSPYCCMVRWHYYRILLLPFFMYSSVLSFVFVVFRGLVWRLM